MKLKALFILVFALPGFVRAQDDPLRLDELLDQALARNPKIKAAGFEAQALSFRVAQEKSLPDPMLNFDLKDMGFPDFTLGQEGMSGVGVSFSQALPYPGKLRLKGEIAGKAYERQRELRNAVAQSVIKDVKSAYFELYALHKSIAILLDQKALLEKASELTETMYAVGKGVQSDVLKARVEISRMDEMLTPMREMIRALEARINLLLDYPADRPLGLPEDQGIEALPLTLEEAQKEAAANSPMIKEAALMVDEGGKMVSLARKELRPNFVVGGGWEFKGRLPSMYEVMLGFEIPLYKKTKQSKMLEESVARLSGSKDALASTTNDVTSMVAESFLKARSSENLIKLYREKIIPQASLTVDASMASYRVNKTDFLALLADINTYFSYQMALYREQANLWSSIALLEETTATSIVTWGGNK
jgi:outer membrane protein TolC